MNPRVVAAVALAAGVVGLSAVPAAAAPAGFGTAAVVRAEGSGPPGTVRSVTYGRNDGFDRVVFTVSSGTMGYRVEYVPEVTADGSGDAVPVAGGAAIAVLLSPTDWTVTPSPVLDRSPDYPGLKQVRSAGEFEANAQYAIGQATKAGFRVLRLTGPDRIVVDVAHPGGPSTPSGSAARPTTPAGTPSATNAAVPPAVPPADPGATTAAGPTPVATSAAATTAPDPGRGSPIPAILLGAAIALAAFAAIALTVRLRRPTLGG